MDKKKHRKRASYVMRVGVPREGECQFCGNGGVGAEASFASGLKGFFCQKCNWDTLQKQKPKEGKVP